MLESASNSSASTKLSVSRENLPVHVGIIMDGNGRWAKLKGKKRTAGHTEGLEAAKKIAKAASDMGIKYLTLYVFSTENWKRTEEEVGYLMNLIKMHLKAEFEFYRSNRLRVKVLGNIEGLPPDIQEEIHETEKETAQFTGTTIVLAINYGGRDEIIRGIKKISKSGISLNNMTEKDFSSYLDFPELPDMDLLIRTGGEKRISNFLLWQSSYAELIFCDTLWPDYTKELFEENILEYQKRTRKFGAVL